MKIIEPGHIYQLDFLDEGSRQESLWNLLTFVKRIGTKYPGNLGPPHAGTNMQDVIKVLINRCLYLNKQERCIETIMVINLLEEAMVLLEMRAARKHGRNFEHESFAEFWNANTCIKCGHKGCDGRCHE